MAAKKPILVVDDDTIICKLLTTYLDRSGFESHSANSGEHAMDILAEKQFFAVITDLKMGSLSGQDIIRHVKRTHPETRVVMITGSCNETDENEAYQNGVDDFFFKPFSMNAILSCLQHPSSR